MRLASERRPDQAGRQRADAGAEQRDADEVRRDQDQRADNPAERAPPATIQSVCSVPIAELANSAPRMNP